MFEAPILSPSLVDIRAAAQRLANAHNDTAATSALMNAEIKAAVAPVLERYKDTIDTYAAAEAMAQAELDDLLIKSPALFTKPRSMTVDGIRCGYRKDEDSFDWDDEAAVIAAIKAVAPELAPLLIRTQESLILDAIAPLDEDIQRKVGIRRITGVDRRFIKVGDNDAEKITKLVVASAAARQGEDEETKPKKGKAQLKVAA